MPDTHEAVHHEARNALALQDANAVGTPSARRGERNSASAAAASCSQAERRANISAAKWKGDDIGYAAIHLWLTQTFPKTGCVHCGALPYKIKQKNGRTRTSTEWALIRGLEHRRDRAHYIELCHKCHARYDATPA